MKVVLLKDIPKVGKKYDIKTVADGHALNQLIPQGLAQVASGEWVKKVEKIKALEAQKKAEVEAKMTEEMNKVKGAVVHIEGKANEKGHLFSAIHKGDIVKKLAQVVGVEIHSEFLKVPTPIKEVGEHSIEMAHGDKSVKFTLVVQPEK